MDRLEGNTKTNRSRYIYARNGAVYAWWYTCYLVLLFLEFPLSWQAIYVQIVRSTAESFFYKFLFSDKGTLLEFCSWWCRLCLPHVGIYIRVCVPGILHAH